MPRDYLDRQGDAYYFRRIVPKPLREAIHKHFYESDLNAPRDEQLERAIGFVGLSQKVTRTLQTTDRREARILAADLYAESERAFQYLYKAFRLTPPQRGRRGRNPVLDQIVIKHREHAVLFADYRAHRPRKRYDNLPKLSECLPDFLAVYTKLGESTKLEMSRAWRLLIDLTGNIPVEYLKPDHILEYRNKIAQIPRRRSREQDKLPLSRLVQLGGDTIKPATQRKMMSAVTVVLDHIQAERRWLEKNPCKGIKIIGYTKVRSDDERRRSFDPGHLEQILGKLDPTRDPLHWIPVVALYSGMRLSEIVQLDHSDIRRIGDDWFFWVNTLRGKRVKTKVSRWVPVHPNLIRRGFLTFVDGCKGRLFEISADAYSKRFGRFLDFEVNLGDPQLTFHSTRHTFKDIGRNSDVPESVLDRITGHAPPNVGSAYGEGNSPASLARWMAKINFPA